MFGGNLAGLALQEPAPGRDDLVHSLAQDDHIYDDRDSHSKEEYSSDLINRPPIELAYPGNNGASLEEYIYWARVQREEERQEELKGVGASGSTIIDVFVGMYRKSRWSKRSKEQVRADAALEASSDSEKNGYPSEKQSQTGKPDTLTYDLPTPQLEGIRDPKTLEGLTTARNMRIAGATSVFFLITTDILGPNSAPYGMSQNGWAQGNILFFVFGCAAAAAAYATQWLFLRLDSTRFPVKTYGDLGHRLLGAWFRNFLSLIQFLQLIVNCGLLVLSNGQALSQIIGQYNKHNLCFAVCVVIFALIGMVLAQIRSLRGLSFLSNLSTVLNWTICIVSMVVIRKSGFSAETVAKQMLKTIDWVNAHPAVNSAWPQGMDISEQIQGVNLLIFAYGGAMIFPELLSEMKKPRSFWKGCCAAQLVIYIVYVVYACVFYSSAGQYSLSVGYQIIAKGPALTFCNVASIVTAVVAGAIYGNVGIKVSYVNVVESWCRGPPIYSRLGRLTWGIWSCAFWAVAWVIGTAVPQINSLSGLISAIAICNFSYTFPFFMVFIWLCQKDAMAADGEWTPYSGNQRIDSWTSASRLKRALFGGMYQMPFGVRIPGVAIKGFILAMALGGLTMSGLGLYAAAETLKTSFSAPGAISTSFGCNAPV